MDNNEEMFDPENFKKFLNVFDSFLKMFDNKCIKAEEFSDTRAVSMAEVHDRKWLYEVAIKHEDYNRGEWIVVASADTLDDIEAKFQYWCNKFKEEDFKDGFFDIFLWTLYTEDIKNG